MEVWHSLLIGFSVALEPINLLYCLVGVLVGNLIGVLPGIGPAATIAILLPVTFNAPPASGIIMLTGIYYGAMYGGSTTSILVNIPGEGSSVVTCLDGYQMARKGRAGPALGMCAFASFIGGTISVLGLMLVAPQLARIAMDFGPPEYFSLMIMGMSILIFLASGSMLKSVMIATFGIILGCVGIDGITGRPRLTFQIPELGDGIGLVPIAMGLFGIPELFENIEGTLKQDVFETKIKGLLPTLQDWMDSKWAILRGTAIGFFLGALPGGGAIISSFVAYVIEKKVSKHPEKFGTGLIEGVASPESANNAAVGGAMVPLLTLGIPSNVAMAIMLGAFMIHGIQPGPLLLTNHPDIFWGIIASMYLGNIMLLVLNLPLIGMWVQILKIPYPLLFPLILLFCFIGAYASSNSTFDMFIMLGCGALGYLMRKFQYEAAPLILAYVLGPMLETALRQSLILSKGNFSVFVLRPISAVCLAIAIILLLSPLLPILKRKRSLIVQEGSEG
jgi:putative tricarboxylic transport membrane protein